MYCLNIFVFYKCFVKHIWIILFPSWNLPHISSLFNEFHVFFFPSLSFRTPPEIHSAGIRKNDNQKSKQTSKRLVRQKKKNKRKEKVYKEHGVHWWLATLGMRPALDVPSDHLLEKTDFSLWQVSVTALFVRKHQIIFVMGGMWCLFLLLVIRILSGLSLCRTCHDIKVFVSSYVYQSFWVRNTLLYWSHLLSQDLTIFLSPLPQRSMSLESMVLMRTLYLGLWSSTSPILCTLANSSISQSMINTIVGPSVQIQEPFEEISHPDQKTGKQRPWDLC